MSSLEWKQLIGVQQGKAWRKAILQQLSRYSNPGTGLTWAVCSASGHRAEDRGMEREEPGTLGQGSDSRVLWGKE